ncbi:MAG: apolipoprotein N-acyltransferase, partial [Planctomycetia bacterium]
MIHRITFLRNSTFLLALLGAILYWAAQPPLDWGWLAWIAPVPWIWLIRQERLPGRRPYRSLWLVGFLLWMAILHFLRLPHPATSIGWVATSGYLAFYLPLFVALSRVGVHRCRWPVVLVAPLVWVGLELFRAHMLTGITMGALAYSQYQWLPVIQIASIFGYYGVGYVVMLVASCLGRMLPNQKSTSEQTSSPPAKWAFWPILPAVIILGATLGYGYSQLGRDTNTDGPSVRVGLVQGTIDITMKCDPDKIEEVNRHYIDLSKKAIDEHPDLDLLVWPETMYRDGLCEADADFKVPEAMNVSDEKGKQLIQEFVDESHQRLNNLTNYFGVPVLFGLDTIEYTSDGVRFYNSSILALPHTTESESLVNRYDKMHRVLFGEYVPFADIFPILQDFTPLPISITAGKGAQVYEVNGVRFCPNICYENVLPHVIRRQVNELREKYQEPDVLVNLTNDGWFWGSSELDLHLACAVFRAVECRKPMLVAANTGISAWIDATGAIRARGPRRDTDLIIADVGPHQEWSLYLDGGDWFA